MQTANYQILREIEKSPYAQYITVPKSILQNYIYNMKLGLQNVSTNANAITNLCNVYNAVFGDGTANILQLYYVIKSNVMKGNVMKGNKLFTSVNNTLLTSVNNYNAMNYFITYLQNSILSLYRGNYINRNVYNFFINVFLQNIITLVETMDKANFSIGDLSYYINGDYENCILSGNSAYSCDYYMEGYKLLEQVDTPITIFAQRRNSANSTNAYIISSTAAANLRMRDPEDQYKICTDRAFANNSSETECNQYLQFF
uniref:Uncharacterized protein n=1 Tax=viral metagenome TaxID=1070528 RepID=A0A6C0I0A7_9ZZZZ